MQVEVLTLIALLYPCNCPLLHVGPVQLYCSCLICPACQVVHLVNKMGSWQMSRLRCQCASACSRGLCWAIQSTELFDAQRADYVLTGCNAFPLIGFQVVPDSLCLSVLVRGKHGCLHSDVKHDRAHMSISKVEFEMCLSFVSLLSQRTSVVCGRF